MVRRVVIRSLRNKSIRPLIFATPSKHIRPPAQQIRKPTGELIELKILTLQARAPIGYATYDCKNEMGTLAISNHSIRKVQD